MIKIQFQYNHKEKLWYAILNGYETRNPEKLGYYILDTLERLPAPKKNIIKHLDK